MDNAKSLDQYKLVAALLRDVHSSHGVVFNKRSLRLTLNKLKSRLTSEGLGFLTKTLPRLGKALDKALSEQQPLNSIDHGFAPMANSKLPRFLGEFFNRVFYPDGTVLPDPCARSVGILRDILYLWYKYELPYTDDQEQQVLQKFERTEAELIEHWNCPCPVLGTVQGLRSESTVTTPGSTEHHSLLPEPGGTLRVLLHSQGPPSPRGWGHNYRPTDRRSHSADVSSVIREARILLARVFSNFDPTDIIPRHGPGSVATKQRLSEKYVWTNVSSNITKVYPLDAYFYASLSHVCDRQQELQALTDHDLPARVILVPKDSRGPRLISCEPVDYQWIQQGLSRRIVQHVETLPLTRFNVFFTDQGPNRRGAQLGSKTGKYATLDLNEASDRVSLDLVRLLFPEHIVMHLEACRSSSTVLPNGKILPLRKFAPMGSALCFPILALTVWSILTAAAPDTDTSEGILVYGDDVIVPTHFAMNAIEQLETFGLKVNRDKSCTSGFFRESCGMDAFKGVPVTPVRFRTVWSSTPCPNAFASWVSYANSLWERGYLECYNYVVEMLYRVYGRIPSKDKNLSCPSLHEVPEYMVPKSRYNSKLFKTEYYALDLKDPIVKQEIDGWSMLLRFFTEAQRVANGSSIFDVETKFNGEDDVSLDRFMGVFSDPFSVRSYTRRRASLLVRRWR